MLNLLVIRRLVKKSGRTVWMRNMQSHPCADRKDCRQMALWKFKKIQRVDNGKQIVSEYLLCWFLLTAYSYADTQIDILPLIGKMLLTDKKASSKDANRPFFKQNQPLIRQNPPFPGVQLSLFSHIAPPFRVNHSLLPDRLSLAFVILPKHRNCCVSLWERPFPFAGTAVPLNGNDSSS